jgi:hypothetical protein
VERATSSSKFHTNHHFQVFEFSVEVTFEILESWDTSGIIPLATYFGGEVDFTIFKPVSNHKFS